LLVCALPVTIGAQVRTDIAAPQDVANTGVISGVVLEGHLSTPLPEATVRLSGRTAAGQSVSTQLITSAEGEFAFRDLQAGQYQVRAMKAGTVAMSFGVGGRSSHTSITLAAGQSASNVRTWLWLPGSISGRVVDERGDPVVGAMVHALAQVMIGGRTRHVTGDPAITDDRGAYRISDLPPGRYVIAWRPGRGGVGIVRDAGGREAAFPATYYPGTRDATTAQPIDLGASEDRLAVDFQIVPVPAGSVEGRLVGPLVGLQGRRLRLLQAGTIELGLGSEAGAAVIRADGSFRFQPVPAGEYVIESLPSLGSVTFGPIGAPSPDAAWARELEGEEHPLRPGGSMLLPSSAGDVRFSYLRRSDGGWVRSPVEVVAGRIQQVVLPVHSTVSMSGRIVVEDPPAPGTMERPGAAALFLSAQPADPSLVFAPASPENLGSDAFTIRGLPAGDHYLDAGALGRVIKSIEWNGQDYTDRPFDTSAGHDFGGIVVTLTSRSSTLVGTVRDGGGATVPSAVVLAFPASRAHWGAAGLLRPRRFGSVATDERGAYRISGPQPFRLLPAGEYFLVAVRSIPANWTMPDVLEAASRVATRVAVDWGETKVVDLRSQQIVAP
jgi:hypothetical protein